MWHTVRVAPRSRRSPPILQPISAGIVAAISGFATSFALVIAGLKAVGASDAQASSGLVVLCLAVGITSMLFAFVYKIPISTAWSTPGAAMLVTAVVIGVSAGGGWLQSAGPPPG